MNKKQIIYIFIITVILTIGSAFVSQNIESKGGFSAEEVERMGFVPMTGCFGDTYKTGLPLSYVTIYLGTCDDNFPKINYLNLVVDFVFFAFVSIGFVLFLNSRFPERGDKILKIFTTVAGACVVIMIAIFYYRILIF